MVGIGKEETLLCGWLCCWERLQWREVEGCLKRGAEVEWMEDMVMMDLVWDLRRGET